jgi:Nif-specific regulatory protein
MPALIKKLQLKILNAVSHALGQFSDLEQALDRVLKILTLSLATKKGAVTLKTGEMTLQALRGLEAGEIKDGPFPANPAIIGRLRQPFVILKGEAEPILLDELQEGFPEKDRIAGLGIPIIHHNSPIGLLSVDRLFPEEIPFEEDFYFLSLLGALISQFVGLGREAQARQQDLRWENLSLKARLAEKFDQLALIGQSPALLKLQQLARKVAPSRAPILLLGEPGLGKGLIARLIHELSPRAPHPFIQVDCASGPEEGLAGDIFGYEKGAFPGAPRGKPGRLEEALGGTVFLKEIDRLSPALQARLLILFQDRAVERLGASGARKVEVRIIAATTVDLAERVKEGLFRDDLYYRLNIFPIRVPPLRERREDLAPLLNYFLDKVSAEYGRRFYFTQQSLEVLRGYAWPGNVREMENLVEHLAIAVEGAEIGLKDLPAHLFPAMAKAAADGAEPFSRLKELEKREILAALARHRWIQSQAAMELGLTLRQIGYRVKRYGLEHLIKKRRVR